jgi:hypothetical protein
MIRIESHDWNKEIKRPDRPVGQRACGFVVPAQYRERKSAQSAPLPALYPVGRLIEKNKMRAMAKNAGYSDQT